MRTLPLIFSAEPSFVFADVIREGENPTDGEDDKIYYFFTEVSVEYEFFGNLLIPRVARVCKVGTSFIIAFEALSFPRALISIGLPQHRATREDRGRCKRSGRPS